MDRYGENKRRSYRCCFNCAFTVDNGLGIYGEGRSQVSLTSTAVIGPLGRIQDTQRL